MSTPRRKIEISQYHFVECPRCKAMAESHPTADGTPFAVNCDKCQLRPHRWSAWDVGMGKQVALLAGWSVEDGLDFARMTKREIQIWHGDVLAASWEPKEGAWYHNGYCKTEG